MKSYLILLGPPGSGKDTQGKRISEHLVLPLVSTGEALRDEIARGTDLGNKFKELIEKGQLVPDEVMFEFISELLSRIDLVNGFVFNGFPRTIEQAEYVDSYLLSSGILVEAVLNLSVSDAEIVKRISGRRTCRSCGAVYNIYYMHPENDEVCDKCGGELLQREDDKEEAVLRRISVYREETLPLIDYYMEKGILFDIFGEGTPDEVYYRLLEVVND